MPQFYQGTREAEYLIDREPERVGQQLGEARRDRRRWKTRFFQREKARFLDGFIARLVAHEAMLERGHANGLVPGTAVGQREADVVQAITALNQSGWSIGEAVLVGQRGELRRVVANPGDDDLNDVGRTAGGAPAAGD